jgi:hypothetical protein
MNKYKVKITHVFAEMLDVAAESEELAREAAVKQLQSEEHKGRPFYETTLPPEHWAVVTEEDYNQMVENIKAKIAEQEVENKIITPNIIVP